MAVLDFDEFFVLGDKYIERGDIVPLYTIIIHPSYNGVKEICCLTKWGLFVKKRDGKWDRRPEILVTRKGRTYLCSP